MSSPSRSLFSPQRSKEAPPEPVGALLKHLKLASVDDLFKVSTATITAAVAEMKLPSSACAVIDIALSSRLGSSKIDSGTAALADAVESQRLSRIYKWLPAEESARRQLARFSEDWEVGQKQAMEGLRSEFSARAKAGSLGPLEALIGQYCLYSEDAEYARFMLMSLLLRVPATQRVAVHNWAVAQDMPRATKEAYGDNIAALTIPLYPYSSSLEVCNTKLLESAVTPAGGADPRWIDGAGWLPVSQQQDGQYGVDTAPLDSAIAQELNDLRQQVRELTTRVGRGRGRGQQQYRQYSPYYGRGRYPRGGEPTPDSFLDTLFELPSALNPPPAPTQPPAVATQAQTANVPPPKPPAKRGRGSAGGF